MELIGNELDFQYGIISLFTSNNNYHNNPSINYIHYTYLTPSEKQGMSQSEEKSIRNFLMSFLQEMGIILYLPHQTILTAMNIANHFYWKQPFHLYEPIYILSACIFLSGKIEESLRKSGNILSSALYILTTKKHNVSKEEINVDYSFLKSFNKMKDNVYNAELVILKELGFDLHSLSFHPHALLLHFIKKINGDAALLQNSWGYLNDMYRTSLIVNYAPNVLACAAIFITSRKCFIAMPEKVDWWVIFETKYEEIEEICAEIMRLYKGYEGFEDGFGLIDCKRIFRRLSDEEKRKKDREKNNNRKYDEDDERRYMHSHRHSHSHSHRHRHHSKRYKSKETYKHLHKERHSRSKEDKHKHSHKHDKHNKRRRSKSHSYSSDSSQSSYKSNSSSSSKEHRRK